MKKDQEVMGDEMLFSAMLDSFLRYGGVFDGRPQSVIASEKQECLSYSDFDRSVIALSRKNRIFDDVEVDEGIRIRYGLFIHECIYMQLFSDSKKDREYKDIIKDFNSIDTEKKVYCLAYKILTDALIDHDPGWYYGGFLKEILEHYVKWRNDRIKVDEDPNSEFSQILNALIKIGFNDDIDNNKQVLNDHGVRDLTDMFVKCIDRNIECLKDPNRSKHKFIDYLDKERDEFARRVTEETRTYWRNDSTAVDYIFATLSQREPIGTPVLPASADPQIEKLKADMQKETRVKPPEYDRNKGADWYNGFSWGSKKAFEEAGFEWNSEEPIKNFLPNYSSVLRRDIIRDIIREHRFDRLIVEIEQSRNSRAYSYYCGNIIGLLEREGWVGSDGGVWIKREQRIAEMDNYSTEKDNYLNHKE